MNRLIERLRSALPNSASSCRTPPTSCARRSRRFEPADRQSRRIRRSDTTADGPRDLRQGVAARSDPGRSTAAHGPLRCRRRRPDQRIYVDLVQHRPGARSPTMSRWPRAGRSTSGVTSPETAPFVGDPRDLRILFGNLDRQCCEIHARRRASWMWRSARATGVSEVTITDTGPGIDPALLPRIFDRFFRAAPAGHRGQRPRARHLQGHRRQHGLTLALSNRSDRTGLRVVVTGRLDEAPDPAPVRAERPPTLDPEAESRRESSRHTGGSRSEDGRRDGRHAGGEQGAAVCLFEYGQPVLEDLAVGVT